MTVLVLGIRFVLVLGAIEPDLKTVLRDALGTASSLASLLRYNSSLL